MTDTSSGTQPCVKPKCSDGTFYDKCSGQKPYFCSGGELVKRCSTCGCPEGLLCDKSSGGCYEKPVLNILTPHENETINIGEEKRVVVSGWVSKGRDVEYSIESNDSRFVTKYDPKTSQFSLENVTPISEGFNSLKLSLADDESNLLSSQVRTFRVIDAPAGSSDLSFLQGLTSNIVQLVLLVIFFVILFNVLSPLLGRIVGGAMAFPEGSLLLVEGATGSGKEGFCLDLLRREIGKRKSCAVLSNDPHKEESWFGDWEKNRLLFVKVEPDINEIALNISKILSGEPKLIFVNILNLLTSKYDVEELVDFLNTNFTKLRNAKCGAVFCIDKGTKPESLSAIEGLFDGVVEFQVQEEKGKLSSYYRVKEFKLKKFNTNWRRFR